MIQRQREDIPDIISGHRLNNVKCVNDSALIDAERKLKEHLNTVVKERKKKELSINFNNKKIMIIFYK